MSNSRTLFAWLVSPPDAGLRAAEPLSLSAFLFDWARHPRAHHHARLCLQTIHVVDVDVHVIAFFLKVFFRILVFVL